jgi:hypothetical protein
MLNNRSVAAKAFGRNLEKTVAFFKLLHQPPDARPPFHIRTSAAGQLLQAIAHFHRVLAASYHVMERKWLSP